MHRNSASKEKEELEQSKASALCADGLEESRHPQISVSSAVPGGDAGTSSIRQF